VGRVPPETIAIALAAVGALLVLAGLRRLFQARFFAAMRSWLAGLVLVAAAALLFGVATNLHTYARLTYEQPVAELAFEQTGEQRYRATLVKQPSGEIWKLDLSGDDWQLDARVLKWRGWANLLGFDALYRLERISGRYRDVAQERSAPRTVHDLADTRGIDLWELSQTHPGWLPFVDAIYGSATYLPMAEGARYEVTLGQAGLIARPKGE
jgi:hypothetical protein